MNSTRAAELPKLSPEDIERLVADYCRLAYEKKAMPHGLFEDPFDVCPWPGCGFRIAGVDFHIERMGNPPFYAQVIKAWWNGPGIAGRCPGCGKYVLFSVGKKQAVEDPAAAAFVILPDNWNQVAFFS